MKLKQYTLSNIFILNYIHITVHEYPGFWWLAPRNQRPHLSDGPPAPLNEKRPYPFWDLDNSVKAQTPIGYDGFVQYIAPVQ